jgi:hypothetical protein
LCASSTTAPQAAEGRLDSDRAVALMGLARAIDFGDERREELHRLIDGLDINDAKRRLHVLVAKMDEETAHRIMMHVEEMRRRCSENWAFAWDKGLPWLREL